MEVGEHCSMKTCKRLDFLPFTCHLCQKVFCKGHCHPDSHNCSIPSSTQQQSDGEGSRGGDHTHLCSAEGCGRREQVEITCPQCHLTLCLAHRHPEDHKCPSLPSPSTRPKTRAPKSTAPPTNSRVGGGRGGAKSDSLSTRVALMRLKQRAEGPQSVPQSERVYYDVTLPAGSRVQSAPLFFSKEWSVGKVVDVVSRKFSITNHNDLPSCSKKLVLLAGDGTVLQASQPLRACLALAPSGSSVTLDYSQ